MGTAADRLNVHVLVCERDVAAIPGPAPQLGFLGLESAAVGRLLDVQKRRGAVESAPQNDIDHA